jgi:hypothetical protein
MGGACSLNVAKRNAYRIVVGKPEGRRPLGRHRCRWEDSIKMDSRWDDIVACKPLIRRVPVRMIGFIISWLHAHS